MNIKQSTAFMKSKPIMKDMPTFNLKRHHVIITTLILMTLFMSVNITWAQNNNAVSNLNASRVSPSEVQLNWTNNISFPAGLDIQLGWFFLPHDDLQRISENFDLFVLTKNFEKERDDLIRRGEDPVLQYLTVDSIDDPCFQADDPIGTTCNCNKAPRNNNVGWNANDICWIRDNHNDWFLRDANGNLIYSGWGSSNNPYIIMDPGKQGWREFYLQRARESQENLGWHGIFMDNLGEIFTAHTGQPVALRDYPTDQSYQDAMVGFLSYLRTNYFAPEGRPMFANFSASWDRQPAYYRYLEQLDGVMDEYWAVTGNDYYRILSYEKRLEAAVRTQELGKTMLLVSQGTRNDYAREQFSLATYLLVATDKAFFRYTNQDNYGEIWLYDNYNIYLGDPQGSYYKQGDKYFRDFTHGRVMVDPVARQSSITTNEIGIEIERSTNGGSSFTRIARVNPSDNSYKDTNAAGSVCYRVRYINGSEQSNFSNSVCVEGDGSSNPTPDPTDTPTETPDTSIVVTGPSGTINTTRPTYTWQPVSGATEYGLRVGSAGNDVFTKTVSADEACNGNTCSVDANAANADALLDGNYNFFVRAKLNGTWSAWSNAKAFTVDSPAADLPQLNPPTNADSLNPTLVWKAGPGALWFQIYLAPTNDLSAPAIQVWVDRNQVCTGDNNADCSYDVSKALLEGTEYSLYMQAWGPGGFSTGGAQGWAGPVKFNTPGQVQAPVVYNVEIEEGRIVVVMPNDNTVQWFNIYLGSPDGSWSHNQWYQKTNGMCGDNGCRILTDAHPTNGSYVAYVQTWGTNGFSTSAMDGWMGPVNFNVRLSAPSTVNAMAQHTDESKPRFGWDEANGATWYNLRVTQGEETVFEKWYSSIEAECYVNDTRCSVTGDVTLNAGETYEWTVRAWGPGGFGPNNDGNNWSEIVTFTK